jgi:hypothetical protein
MRKFTHVFRSGKSGISARDILSHGSFHCRWLSTTEMTDCASRMQYLPWVGQVLMQNDVPSDVLHTAINYQIRNHMIERHQSL